MESCYHCSSSDVEVYECTICGDDGCDNCGDGSQHDDCEEDDD